MSKNGKMEHQEYELRNKCGENLMGSCEGCDEEAALTTDQGVKMWYDEIKDYDFSN